MEGRLDKLRDSPELSGYNKGVGIKESESSEDEAESSVEDLSGNEEIKAPEPTLVPTVDAPLQKVIRVPAGKPTFETVISV